MVDRDVVQWPGRSHIATFIHCLHLLDLNLLEDWPGITEQTFNARVSQQNTHLRIKGVEWCLYRLLELYSPTETRYKLRPFFPPTTSLQSMNLRAALLRALTDLRKNGVLPRDVVLRKTMLDECKGERFEELLSSLATLALRQITSKSKKLPASPLNHDGEVQCVPLILAHRHSIQGALQQRRRIDEQTDARQKQLNHVAESLSQRKSKVLKQMPCVDVQRRKEAVGLLRNEWTGDSRWINAILYEGNSYRATSQQSQERIQDVHSRSGTDSLLIDLNQRLEVQRDRVRRWRTFQQSFPAQDISIIADVRSEVPVAKPLISFDKHQSITLELPSSHPARRDVPEQTPRLHGPLVELLDRMNSEPSTDLAPPMDNAITLRSPADVSTSSAPDFTTHAQSLKRQHGGSVGQPQDIERCCLEDYQRPAASPQVSSPAKDDSSNAEHIASDFSWLNESQEQSYGDALLPSPATESVRRENLTDRTRKSMAALFSSDMETSQEALRSAELPTSSNSPPRKYEAPLSVPDLRGTLLERTRQSMAATTARSHASALRARQNNSRTSRLHSVSQFDTPVKPTHRQSIAPPSTNDSTPVEKLFSEEAEYTTIFKSRPKIAQSPVLSPQRSAMEDSILARDITMLDINSDDTGKL